jgi:uncharacterized protein
LSQTPDVLTEDPLASNDEYRRLEQQHHEYETLLHTLTEKAVLSDDEQLEETTLKKKKLLVKDRMEAIARQHREGVSHP